MWCVYADLRYLGLDGHIKHQQAHSTTCTQISKGCMDADNREELVHFLSVSVSSVYWLVHACLSVRPSRQPWKNQRGDAACD